MRTSQPASQSHWVQTDGATFFMTTGLQFEVGETGPTDFEHSPFICRRTPTRCQRSLLSDVYYDSAIEDLGVDGLYSNGAGAGLNVMIHTSSSNETWSFNW